MNLAHVSSLAALLTIGCAASSSDPTIARSDTSAAPAAACGQLGQACCAVTNGDPLSACSSHQAAAWPSGVYCIRGTCQAWQCPNTGWCSGMDAPGCCAGSWSFASPSSPTCAMPPPDATTCVTCGGAGQPCCKDDWCDGASYCRSDGTCQARCGGFGDPCCTAPLDPRVDPPAGCRGGTSCDSAQFCEPPCGQRGQPCCFDATACSAGLTCNGSSCV